MKSILFQLRNLVCAALAGAGIFATGCTKPKYTWNTEDEYFKLPIWKQHVKTYKKMHYLPQTATVFIGDSMTEGFDLQRHLGDENLVNMGISGDFTSGVLRRLEYVSRLQPKRIFIMIGINDILKSVPQDRIKSQYASIISTLRTECPQAQIFIQSNLPTTNMGGNEIANNAVVERVRDLNAFLIEISNASGANFINLYPYFEVDGSHLNPEYSYDGLHLSENGYHLWSSQIKSILVDP